MPIKPIRYKFAKLIENGVLIRRPFPVSVVNRRNFIDTFMLHCYKRGELWVLKLTRASGPDQTSAVDEEIFATMPTAEDTEGFMASFQNFQSLPLCKACGARPSDNEDHLCPGCFRFSVSVIEGVCVVCQERNSDSVVLIWRCFQCEDSAMCSRCAHKYNETHKEDEGEWKWYGRCTICKETVPRRTRSRSPSRRRQSRSRSRSRN